MACIDRRRATSYKRPAAHVYHHNRLQRRRSEQLMSVVNWRLLMLGESPPEVSYRATARRTRPWMWLTQDELRSESSILAAFLARDLGLFSAEWHQIRQPGPEPSPYSTFSTRARRFCQPVTLSAISPARGSSLVKSRFVLAQTRSNATPQSGLDVCGSVMDAATQI